jgi:hypothetical protein
VVGFNISGLLLNRGYTQKNMFGLKNDYRELIYSVIDAEMPFKSQMGNVSWIFVRLRASNKMNILPNGSSIF